MPFETTVLPDVAPSSADAPPFWEPEPTQTIDAVDLERDPPIRQPQPQPTSVFPAGGPSPDDVVTADEQLSAIDALFGANQFREYSDGLDPTQNPFARQAAVAAGVDVPADPTQPARPPGPPPAISRLQKVLLWVLGSMLAVLALVALFFLGMRLPDLLGPSPAVTAPSPSPTPSASPTIPLGPVAPGEYVWNELLGGECLDPYESPWQTTYTVVDCAAPHPAQMVHRGVIPETEPPAVLYPGEDVLQTQAIQLCRGPDIMDNDAARKLKDLIVSVSYPTESVWNEGGRDFFCFVTQSTGEAITGDLALPQVAPEPAS